MRYVALGVAALALLLHAALAVTPCHAVKRGAAAEAAHGMVAGVICLMEGVREASSGVPADGDSQPASGRNDCPACANGCAFASAPPLPEETFVAAPLAAPPAFAFDAARNPAGAEQLASRNRGPPLFLRS